MSNKDFGMSLYDLQQDLNKSKVESKETTNKPVQQKRQSSSDSVEKKGVATQNQSAKPGQQVADTKEVVNQATQAPVKVQTKSKNVAESVANLQSQVVAQEPEIPFRKVKEPVQSEQVLADEYHTPFDFVSQLLDRDKIDTEDVSLAKELSKSTSGKIPTLLWDEARLTWINSLGYAGKSTKIKAFNNTSLVAGLLIRSLNMEPEQRDSLIRAFPHADIIHDIVYYKEDGNVGSISSSLADLKQEVAQLQQSVENHDSYTRRILGGIKRVVSWLFLERVGYGVGSITSKNNIPDATGELLEDYTTRMSSELDVIGDAETKRERTTRKSRRI